MSYQKNDVLTVKIEDMGHDGEGIGKCEGYTLFVKDTVIGDLAEVKVIKAKKNYGYARLMRLIEPSAHRVEPVCPVARPCGGCQLQMLDYAEQLRFKEKKIAGNLQRIGGMTEIPMEPIVGMENPFRYRNKAQFPIGQDRNGKLITGFYAGRTHQIMENRNCYLGVEQNEEILNRILAWMEENGVPAYNEETGKGLVRHVLIRFGFMTKEIMVCLVVNGSRIPIHGVTLYHANAISGGALIAPDYEADLGQIRTLGANALRSAVMPPAQYLYDRCDELGMLVWVDAPFHRSSFLGDVAYYATPQFEQNGLQQLQEIIAQNYNHPSVVMWGIFSRLWTRGNDVTPYLGKLNAAAHALDPSRPTVACSDQDGNINFITDLIVWRQDVGWRKGSTDDVAVWRNQLQKNWSNLRSGVCYGGSGFTGHKSYTAQAAPRSNWMPEERQTRFHEEYVKNLQNDSLFWGTWINNMFDYGSARRPYGINGEGLVTIDRRERKDAYYLYRALWNERKPTLHIVDKRRSLRDRNRQAFSVYSSVGAPTLFVGADTVAMTQYAACQYRSDSVEIQGIVKVKAVAGEQCDSVTLRVGNVLKPKRQPVPRRTAGPQQTN